MERKCQFYDWVFFCRNVWWCRKKYDEELTGLFVHRSLLAFMTMSACMWVCGWLCTVVSIHAWCVIVNKCAFPTWVEDMLAATTTRSPIHTVTLGRFTLAINMHTSWWCCSAVDGSGVPTTANDLISYFMLQSSESHARLNM